jgi:hypothetical protein
LKTRIWLVILLVTVASAGTISPILAADTLAPSDFQLENWARTVDLFDFARAYASSHNMTAPPSTYHSYVYMTYINTSGLQLLYAGLSNITFNEESYFSIPMQTFMKLPIRFIRTPPT